MSGTSQSASNLKILLRGGVAIAVVGFLVFVGDRIPFRIALEDYTASALSIFGAAPLGSGLVEMAGNYFYVGWDCSSAFVGLMYLTVLSLAPLGMRVKLGAASLGFPLIFLVNLLRLAIIILSYVSLGPFTLFWTHLVVGPLLMSGFVIMLWFLIGSRFQG